MQRILTYDVVLGWGSLGNNNYNSTCLLTLNIRDLLMLFKPL